MVGAADTVRFPFCLLVGFVAWVGWSGLVRAEEAAEPPANHADDSSRVDNPASDTGDAVPRTNYFSLDRLDAYLEFESTYDFARVKSGRRDPLRKGFTQRNQDLRFEETVGFEFDGSIADPGLVSYTGSFAFGLSQERFKEKSRFLEETDSDTGYLSEYDLRANLFQGRRLSGTVYGLQRDDRISRRFQPSLREDRTGFGTSWFFTHDTFPMELTYDYLETDRTGNRDRFDDEHFTESTLHYGAEWIISDAHRFKLSYEHAENKQEYQGKRTPFETTRDLLTLDHELAFGEQKRHTLRTLIHYQEESGDFARDFFEIGPQLTLQHTDNLQTLYKYQFNRERFQGLDIETQRVDWQLIHQVYSNLTTTVDIFALHEDIEDDVNITQSGGSVDWQYNRKNPYGHFYANLALAYDTEHASGNDGTRIVLDEAATFRDPLPVYLRNRDVLRHAIVVTDTRNLRLYFEGVDYLVAVNRNSTQLVRIPTGRIADNTTVFVDYEYRTPERGQIDTLRVDFSVEQRFSNGITPYYRLSYRNQEDDFSTGFDVRADRTHHHRLGVKYEQKRYTVGWELELFDDTIEPYDAFHIDGLWHLVQTPEHAVDASGRWSRFFFEGGFDRRNVNMLDLEVDHRWHMGDNVSTFERTTFRWEDDSVDGITRAWDVAAGLEYAIGDFTAELSLEYDRLDLPESTEDDLGVWLRIRRDIPNVLAKW